MADPTEDAPDLKQETAQKKSSKFWIEQLELAEDEDKDFVTRGEKIVERYRDKRPATANDAQERRYNILWSNTRTLLPALYSQRPDVVAERRHKDADPIGRVASQILERSLAYDIEYYPDFDASLRSAVLDRLLPGRGVAWVRYEAKFEQITDDAEEGEPSDDPDAQDPGEVLERECCPADYVFWKDFRCSPARTWEEVTWVARRVYMTRAKGEARFGKDFKNVPLGYVPKGVKDDSYTSTELDQVKKAKVWEIWDKDSETVTWVAEGYQYILDERHDPLELEEFFPCPKPLLATTSTDSIVPVADYVQYQDQANELDDITNRIHKLVKACRVVGVYAGSSKAVQRLLDEGTDNQLIPVENWMEHAERGGLNKLVDFMPLDQVIKALAELYRAEEEVKNKIYEITGLSDIIRGASMASETATAQKIKANYAGLRLKETQADIARFATDILRRKAQIMAKYYDDQTLIDMSGVLLLPEADEQQVAQALALIRNEPMSAYRIEVAADSLVELDEEEQKRSRMEFLQAAGGFLQQALPVAQQQPEMAPLLTQMLMFGVRAFKAGRDLEQVFESTFAAMQQKQQQAESEPEKPDPEQIKQEGQQQLQAQQQQHEQAMEAIRAQQAERDQQYALQLENVKQQGEAVRAEMDRRHEQVMAGIEQGFARFEAELKAATSIEVAQISATKSMDARVDDIVDSELDEDLRNGRTVTNGDENAPV